MDQRTCSSCRAGMISLVVNPSRVKSSKGQICVNVLDLQPNFLPSLISLRCIVQSKKTQLINSMSRHHFSRMKSWSSQAFSQRALLELQRSRKEGEDFFTPNEKNFFFYYYYYCIRVIKVLVKKHM